MSRGRARVTADRVYAVVAMVCGDTYCPRHRWNHGQQAGTQWHPTAKKCTKPDEVRLTVVTTYAGSAPATTMVNAFVGIEVHAEIRVGSPLEWERYDGTTQEKYETAERAIELVAKRAQEALVAAATPVTKETKPRVSRSRAARGLR